MLATPRIPFAAGFLLLLALAWIPTLYAQRRVNVLLLTSFNYSQTSPTTAEPHSATMSIDAYWREGTIDETIKVALSGAGQSVSLQFVRPAASSPSYEPRFVATVSYPDAPALLAAWPVGDYDLSITQAGSTRTQKVTLVRPDESQSPSLLRSFDALQSWDGGNLALAWEPYPVGSSGGLVINRADGTMAYSAPRSGPGISTPVALSSLSTTLLINTPPLSIPGEIFTGILSIYRGPEVGSGPIGISLDDLNKAIAARAEIERRFAAGEDVLDSLLQSTVATTRFPLKRPGPAPRITGQPASLTATAGTTATFSPAISASGATYLWKKDGIAVTGATQAQLTLVNVRTSDAGSYTVTVTNSGGSVTSNTATLTVIPATVPPSITTAPVAMSAVAGASVALTVTAAGTTPLTYQWLRNGTAISGATSSTLTFATTLVSDAGAYSVTITNSAGSITSPAAVLAVTPISRISNLSVLTSLADASDSFSLGYVLGGGAPNTAKPIILRAAGPALGALGVGGTLDDPKLETFTGPTKTGENDNWGSSATSAGALAAAFTAVGAFPFTSPISRDAALATSLTTRDNSVKVTSANASGGLVLAEIYDASPAAAFIATTPRLLNVSVLKSLGTGLTVGFTLAGSTPKTVLIRAIGPTLGDFGVPGTVADPQLALFNSASVKIAENDNWAATPALATSLSAAFTAVGAFALPTASRDAALLATLPPGGYSVQVSGVNATTGVALVEVYEVP